MNFDLQYAHLLKEVLMNGHDNVEDRTGNGRRRLFSKKLVMDVSDNQVPLLRLRRIGPRIGFRECQWMMNGDTDVKTLQDDGIHIWDGNTTAEALAAAGKSHITPNTIGKGYGYQFRNFNGVDQLANVMDQIAKNPHGSRHVINLWNPADLQDMALPPCHLMYEFFVYDDKISIYQHMRSADLILGVPTNVVFATTMLKLVAKLHNLKPDTVVTDMTDCHIYLNHIDATRRILGAVPKLNALVQPKFDLGDIEINSIDDMVSLPWKKEYIQDYDPILKIGKDEIPMAV